jgi:hypothetical protein
MTTRRALDDISNESQTCRLALVEGWFQLAKEARERHDVDEARACESEAREHCTAEEYCKYLAG